MTYTPQYETDFYAWTQVQAARLRALPPGAGGLDRERLAEEIEGLGEAQVFRVSSLLRRTLFALLKIAAAPDAPDVARWHDEAITCQGDAVLAFSSGLRQRIDLDRIWKLACNGATASLAVRGDAAPDLRLGCPLTLDELLSWESDLLRAGVAGIANRGRWGP